MRKVTLYIAMSEDGFIAGEGDDLSFLNTEQLEGEDFGYARFLEGVDTVIVGRRTYDVVRGMGHVYHPNKRVFVITRNAIPVEDDPPSLHRWTGDLVELVATLRSEKGSGIYCDGGAQVAGSMLEQGLIDEMILTVFPTRLQRGVGLFPEGKIPSQFEAINQRKYFSGLVQYRYLRKWG
jgi:dihydrofolate reductase